MRIKNRIEIERRFWNSFAKKYDKFISKNSNGTHNTILDYLEIDTDKTENLLEIATVTEIISLRLCENVSKITAIDIDPEMIKIAKKKI